MQIPSPSLFEILKIVFTPKIMIFVHAVKHLMPVEIILDLELNSKLKSYALSFMNFIVVDFWLYQLNLMTVTNNGGYFCPLYRMGH